jgi:hypothetical protein
MNQKLRIQNIFSIGFSRLVSSSALCIFAVSAAIIASQLQQTEKLDIADVWAGHPVNFALRTDQKLQCVAYFDKSRQMVIAGRTPGTSTWSYTTLRTTPTGWDSHNYIDMAIDDSGYVHVSGDMHNVKLIYFRSKKPWSIESFESPGMVGTLENSVTYPVFIKGPQNKLFFQYRDGGSGSGTTIWNRYDISTKKWARVTTSGLFDGENQVNAYQSAPVMGPDGFFHVIWMWRETPVANTNFHLSHMKSYDLINWLTMSGTPLQLPVRQSTQGVVADPVSSGKGLINMDFGIGWDSQKRAVLTYHRYDNTSVSQIFNTRYENGAWKIYQTSDWKNFKWNLDLQGSLTHDVGAEPVVFDNGQLIQKYIYRDNIKRQWILDEPTLKPSSDAVFQPPAAMADMYKLESTFKGMQVNIIRDGDYYIKWETMPINQDLARADGTYPASSKLRVYKFETGTHTQQIAKTHQQSTSFLLSSNKLHIINTIASQGWKNELSIFTLAGKKLHSVDIPYNGSICISDCHIITKGTYIFKVTSQSNKKETSLSQSIITLH